MPEFVEAEAYRRTLAPVVGDEITLARITDERLLRRGDHDAGFVISALVGSAIVDVRRIGKLVFADLTSGHTAAVSFGLRGRLLLDGRTASATPTSGRWRERPARPDHVRLHLELGPRRVEVEDQLRLAALEIDLDETRLGTDVLAIEKREFRELVVRSDAAIKSVLMDQRRIAGIGNLIADEILYQGKVDPRRPGSSLGADELDELWSGLRRTRERVLDRNGSHQGVQIQSGTRERGASCPRCGVEVERFAVGGRTTYACPRHQR